MNNSIIADKFEINLKFVGYTLATGFVGSTTLVALALLAKQPNYLLIGGWYMLSMLNFFVRYITFARTKHLPAATKVSLSAKARVHLLISGSIWGLASFLFIPTLPILHQAVFAWALFAVNITTIPLMSDARSISALFLPAWLPTAYVFYTSDRSLEVLFVIFLMLWCVYTVAFITTNSLDDLIAARSERAALQDANVMQMSFFLAASHDFRQPLQAMALFAFGIKNLLVNSPDAIGAEFKKLDATFKNLQHLIDETIGFAKISTGMQLPSIRTISAAELVEPLRASFQERIHSKGLRFKVRCDDDCIVKTDVQILKRIVDNLVSNAMRYTDKGGVLVAIRNKKGLCTIQVWDSGAGIAQAERERIFEAFYQSERNGAEGVAGFGLGLMIVKRLSERIGAELSVSSRVNKGSMFQVTLPISTEPLSAKEEILPAVGEHCCFDGHTIAIVDDDQDIRESLTLALSGAGAKVITGSNRATLFKALGGIDALSLLISDLHVGNESGLDIADTIKARFPASPVIILTGDTSDDAQSKLKHREFTVLLKPIPSDVLFAAISSVIDIAPNAAEAVLG